MYISIHIWRGKSILELNRWEDFLGGRGVLNMRSQRERRGECRQGNCLGRGMTAGAKLWKVWRITSRAWGAWSWLCRCWMGGKREWRRVCSARWHAAMGKRGASGAGGGWVGVAERGEFTKVDLSHRTRPPWSTWRLGLGATERTMCNLPIAARFRADMRPESQPTVAASCTGRLHRSHHLRSLRSSYE